MNIAIIKQERGDRLEVERDDGTRVALAFPRKGPAPHDAVHYLVERALGFDRAFWGLIAAGREPEEIQELAKAGGHASAKRADIPDAVIVELLQAERVVECFEAALWDGSLDPATFRSIAEVACTSSHVPTPAISDEDIVAIDAEVRSLAVRWGAAPAGETIALVWGR